MFEDSLVDLPLVKFTAEDRCDQCGAQAFSMARRDDAKSELLFCLHHRREHFVSLTDNDWVVIDDYEAAERLAEQEGITV